MQRPIAKEEGVDPSVDSDGDSSSGTSSDTSSGTSSNESGKETSDSDSDPVPDPCNEHTNDETKILTPEQRAKRTAVNLRRKMRREIAQMSGKQRAQVDRWASLATVRTGGANIVTFDVRDLVRSLWDDGALTDIGIDLSLVCQIRRNWLDVRLREV